MTTPTTDPRGVPPGAGDRAAEATTTEVSFGELCRVFAKIGVLGFGGPAGQIALMHRELVERRRWIGEDRYLQALNYCMLLPGPEAQQLATYVGWLLHGTRGALAAGSLFVLPGFAAILALSWSYVTYGGHPIQMGLFFGAKAAVLAIVVEAGLRIGRRALRTRGHVVVAMLAFALVLLARVPFPWIVVGAGAVGWWGGRFFGASAASSVRPVQPADDVIEALSRRGGLAHTSASLSRTLRTLFVAGALWALPWVVLAGRGGVAKVLIAQAEFFSKAAVVTFGGAYAVLSFVGEQAVHRYGWLTQGELLDGLALAETTPGPLIMVVQFVGFMGAYRQPGGLEPWLAGVLGSVVTVWVTFVPSFLWILAGAPFAERVRSHAKLRSALATVSAAVVGVVASLLVWFATAVLFRAFEPFAVGPWQFSLPVLASFDLRAGGLTALSLVLLLRLHVGLGWTLVAVGALGVLLHG